MLGGPAAQFLACPAGDSAFFTCPPRLYHYTRLALRIDAAWLLGHPFAQPPLRKQLIWANAAAGRVALLVLPAVALCLIAMSILMPQDTYTRPASIESLRQELEGGIYRSSLFPNKMERWGASVRFCGQPSIYRADGTARTQPKQNAAVSARFFRKRLYRC